MTVACLVALALCAGCGDDDAETDAGRDASAPDASTDGGGEVDAASDAGADDAGITDAGAQCSENDECGEAEFCSAATCDADGRCTPRPEACPDVIDWVCGCDGTSYSNSCEANVAGVNVAARGRCEGAGDAGMSMACTENAECAEDAYCAKAAGDCEGTGACTPRPIICSRLLDQHCGCDGMTYSNDCVAARSGVNVVARGACGSCGMRPPEGCCFEDSHCGLRGQRCVNAMCVADGAGVCVSSLLAVGQCWETSDCPLGQRCEGAVICPCGMRCREPNAPGMCRRLIIRE
ncbi:MAG: hypothetical protein KF901_30815 [Myxococcales bacterium]|nr:hypothetical protein [Myxococcales bacterium]